MRIGQILYGFVIIISTAQRDVHLSRSREFSSDINKNNKWRTEKIKTPPKIFDYIDL